MNNSSIFLSTLALFFISLNSQAQELSSRILDSVTQEPIPYVTVQLKNKGVITNEEGQFSFRLDCLPAVSNGVET